jgi:adenylate cyclase
MLALTDIERAAHFVDRALALDPNQAWAWTRRGFLHVYRDDPQSGIPCFERAIRLSPLDPFHFNCYIGLGLAHFAAGAPREAARWTERALGERLGMTWPYRDLTVFLAHAGEIEAARKALARLTATRPHLTLRYVEDSLGFMTPPLRQRYVEGLRLAGLSE